MENGGTKNEKKTADKHLCIYKKKFIIHKNIHKTRSEKSGKNYIQCKKRNDGKESVHPTIVWNVTYFI